MQRNCNILAYSMEKPKASKLGPAVRRFLYIYIYIYAHTHSLGSAGARGFLTFLDLGVIVSDFPRASRDEKEHVYVLTKTTNLR